MAQTPYAGLFTGPSQGDIRQVMRREQRGLSDKAFRDTLASGNLDAANAAKYRQDTLTAFENIGTGLAGAIDQGLGLEGRLVQRGQDPRLGKAIKRDRDKSEIMSLLSGFAEEGSDGGKNISDKELKLGFAELMKRGYDKEAAEWLKRAQSIQNQGFKKRELGQKDRELDIEENTSGYRNKTLRLKQAMHDLNKDRNIKSTKEVGDFKDENDRVYTKYINIMKDGTTSTLLVPHSGENSEKPFGKVRPTDESGMTSINRTTEAGRTSELVQKPKRVTDALRISNQLQADEESRWQVKREGLLVEAIGMRPKIEKVSRLADLAEKVKTGGYRADILGMKEYFGAAPADATEFDTQTKELVKAMLKDMGRNPTDFDLKFLLSINPGMLKSSEGNIRILRMMEEAYTNRYDNLRWLGEASAKGKPRSRGEWNARMLPPSKELIVKYKKRLEKILGEEDKKKASATGVTKTYIWGQGRTP